MDRGIGLVILAALMGVGVSLYDYVTPATGIDHSAGVLLVLASNALMLGAGLLVALLGQGGIATVLMFLILLDIAGTGTAAWFLESPLLIAAITVAAIGWLSRVLSRARRPL